MSVAGLFTHSALGSSTRPCARTLQFPSWVAQANPSIVEWEKSQRCTLLCFVQQGEECVCGVGGEREFLEDPLSLASAQRILSGQDSFRDRMEGGQEKPKV